jgi:superfamily II DNA/RNA helicase
MHPFPIQIATLPDALAGHDILGRGQTGSGKTLAFGLALLNNLNGKVAKPHKPLALVLTPTRELAQQIDEVLMPLARSIGHESVVVAGGMSYAKQITAMRRGTAILVATPGRLIDLLNKGEVQLDHLQITVLDEADQMADMGFLPVVKEILDQAKLDGQRLLFSATLDRGVDSLVRQYLKNPKTHSLQNDRASVSTMEHFVLVMNPSEKDDITNQVAARNGKTILFVKTQRGADRLADKLAHAGVPVGALHGGKSQAVRTRTLALFKDTANAALVATDVAARGIHVDGISLVVHVDAPTDHKDYLHRAGRTARAGEAGKGFAVVANEVKSLANETHKMTDEISKKVRDIKDSALKLNLLNGIPLCTYHHKFGPYSHHKNPVWFIHWLQNNRPKQFQYVLEHCGDLIDLNNREVVEEIEKKIDSPLTEAEKDILNCTQSGDPTLRPPEKEEEVKEKTIFDNP